MRVMTLSEALLYAAAKLESSDIENARFDARCIIEHIADVSLTELMLGGKELSHNEFDALKFALDRRISGVPLQYIIGEWEFMGHTFKVGEGVLIPRPETELLVELALDKLKGIREPVVYDLCSGSGCIGLSIAAERPDARVYLFEKYTEAFEFLQDNCRIMGCSGAHGIMYDIFRGADGLAFPEPDIIVSNPPYIRSDEMSALQTEVLHEPGTALDGGEDGLDFYRVIAQKWVPFIKKHGSLIVECDPEQTVLLVRIFMPQSLSVRIYSDTFGLPRAVCADKY